MKTIIVPTDFSQNAFNALEYALAIARKMPAKVLLFHSYHLPASNTTTFRDITPILKQDAERAMANLIKQVKSNSLNDSITCESIVRKGHLLEQLSSLVTAEHAHLVVIGTKGATGLAEVFIGTTAASVIEHLSCPVMAVPECATFNEIHHILYATNYLTADMDSISRLTQIASLFNASILVAHIAAENSNKAQEEASIYSFEKEVAQTIYYPHLQFRLIESKDIYNGIENIIGDMKIDLIATTTQRRNLYQKLMSSSFTKKMVYQCHIPLLAFHC